MGPYDVFLSHHSSDKPWVIALKAALVERGVSVWLDRDEIRPGDLFVEALSDGVASSRSLAIIVSPASVRSKWVTEEYQRALVLANSSTAELRIIPCLLRGAELPGFLASRQCVDFRDPSSFEAGVDNLCFGITGRRPEAGNSRPTLTGGDVTAEEVKFLERWINELKKERHRLTMTRMGAPLLGLNAGFYSPAGADAITLAVIASVAITGFLGLAATARRWSACTQELKQLTTHRDVMERCVHDYLPVCPDVVEAFNRLLKRRIGLEGDAAEKRT
jgi:hypothetical protein